jgi:hypothetical protein
MLDMVDEVDPMQQRMIKHNKPTVVSVQNAMVSWFCIRPTSKRWFLKTVQVTMKHDPLDAM